MAEQKIVIRLNKAANALPAEMPAKIEVQKVWNIKRIIAFLAALGVILFFLSKGFLSTNSKPDNREVPISKPVGLSVEKGNGTGNLGEIVNGVAVQKEKRKTASALDIPVENEEKMSLERRVTKAQFTHGIRNNKPVDRLFSPIIVSSEKALTISFFTALDGMAGEMISHQWRHNGRIVAEIKFDVRDDHWRVYSSKYLNNTMQGQWQVAVLDAQGTELKSEDFVVKD